MPAALRWSLYLGLSTLGGLLLAAAVTTPASGQAQPPLLTPIPTPRNLLAEHGITAAASAARIDATWQQLFYGDAQTQRIYYEVAPDMAYILDVGDGDVRSEGMSYGMLIAVTLNHQAEFNRLWRWATTYMLNTTGARTGYFAWQCSPSGQVRDPNPAPDGDQYFAMALYQAAHRWGNGAPPFDYQTQADRLLTLMLHKEELNGGVVDGVTNMFKPDGGGGLQVVFTPYYQSATHTDPSYHLPAFYSWWSAWGPPADRAAWAAIATRSRWLLGAAMHPVTGLAPDYSEFTGAPHVGGGHEDFRFDAWRVLGNLAVDWQWNHADPQQPVLAARALTFFATQGRYNNQYSLIGTGLSGDHSPGHIAQNALGSMAVTEGQADPFVQEFWNTPIPSGTWRYYDGLLYMLALIHTAGVFQPIPPAGSGTPGATPPATTTLVSTVVPPAQTVTPPGGTPPAGTPTATACAIHFSDMASGDPFYSVVQCLTCRGIISGYDDGTFRPNQPISRGQIAKVVALAAGFTETPGAPIFVDVPPAHPFYAYIQRLAARQILGGYSDPIHCPGGAPCFQPAGPVTRGQLAKIVSRAAGWEDPPGAVTFADVPTTQPFYPYIARMVGHSIMIGYPCGGPGEPCDAAQRPYARPAAASTRGQAVKMTARAFLPDCTAP